VSDTPQLFDPDAFAPSPDPVEAHDLDPVTDAVETVEVDDEGLIEADDEVEPLLEEPVEVVEEDDADDDAALAAAVEADVARPPAERDPAGAVGGHAVDAAHSATTVDPTAVPVDEETEVEPVSRSVLDTVLGSDMVVEKISLGAPPVLRSVAGGRHEARERAVHLLYEVQIKGLTADEVLAEQVLAPDEYAEDLVRGVATHRAELDEIIDRLARGWTVARMPTMDVVVLRLALFELAHRPDVPRGVILAEAVDLAGQYGTDDSSKFVNGLLAAAANELRSE